jgi:hypothetical protein
MSPTLLCTNLRYLPCQIGGHAAKINGRYPRMCPATDIGMRADQKAQVTSIVRDLID